MSRLKLKSNESGLVAIVVTMVFIILMTLVVLAMAQSSNREQRQALDRQLSDQAFYNAESGINVWANYLKTATGLPVEKNNCGNGELGSSVPTPPDGSIDSVNSYSCVTYHRAPPTLQITDLDIDKAKVLPIRPVSATINSLKFTWKSNDPGPKVITGCPSAIANLPSNLGPNCSVGGLRIELVSVPKTGSFLADSVVNNNFVAYVMPGNSLVAADIIYSTAIGPSGQGAIGRGACNNAECNFSINGINGIPGITPMSTVGGSQYYLVIRSLYKISDVEITAGPGYILLEDAQTELDVTGKSKDVLRRVVVRLPVADEYANVISAGIKTSGPVCKLLKIPVDASPVIFGGCP